MTCESLKISLKLCDFLCFYFCEDIMYHFIWSCDIDFVKVWITKIYTWHKESDNSKIKIRWLKGQECVYKPNREAIGSSLVSHSKINCIIVLIVKSIMFSVYIKLCYHLISTFFCSSTTFILCLFVLGSIVHVFLSTWFFILL